MKKLFILLFLTLVIHAQEIRIAAAANLSYALPELEQLFLQKHPDAHFRITIGGSGKLAAQIERGAPYDLFLSADKNYPLHLYKVSKALQKPKEYAKGALVLFGVQKRRLLDGVEMLRSNSIKTIAIANPKTAPYGKAAFEALHRSGLYESLRSKLVYAESISQTLAYALRASDAGFIAKSALFSPRMRRFKEGVNWVEVSPDLYTPIAQAALLLPNAKANGDAKAFFDFLFSKEAKEVFVRFGYKVDR